MTSTDPHWIKHATDPHEHAQCDNEEHILYSMGGLLEMLDIAPSGTQYLIYEWIVGAI